MLRQCPTWLKKRQCQSRKRCERRAISAMKFRPILHLIDLIVLQCNGTKTNSKVRGGHTSGAKRRNFLSCRSSILSLQVQLIVLVSAFVLVSTVWSVSCLLFLYSWCPRAQPAVKVGGTCPRALSNRRHCTVVL